MSLRSSRRPRRIFALASLLTMIAVYTAISNAQRLISPVALPESLAAVLRPDVLPPTQDIAVALFDLLSAGRKLPRSEEHTSELQSLRHLVCRLLLEKK